MTYVIRKQVDGRHNIWEDIATAKTLAIARIKAANLIRKYKWKPQKGNDFFALEVCEQYSPNRYTLIGLVAVNREGVALWFGGGVPTETYIIYKNGRISDKKGLLYNSKYDRW